MSVLSCGIACLGSLIAASDTLACRKAYHNRGEIVRARDMPGGRERGGKRRVYTVEIDGEREQMTLGGAEA